MNPNDIDDEIFGYQNSNLNVFHNNVRTLNNFDNVSDIFHNCTVLPDVLALTETRLKADKNIPDLKDYSFEHVNSPTAAGGVGAFISNKLKYSVMNDLSLNVKNCEDIWLKVETDKGCDLIIGIIYRHPGPHFENFTDKLCENLYKINMS